MKYHANAKTVFISLLITLLFALFSVTLLFELNLTSPTLIVTEKILSNISNVDSSINIKFDSLERNFSDRVMVNNFSLSYSNNEILSFDKVEVKLGLFDIIKYFLGFDGSAEINFKDGEIILPKEILENSDSSGSSNQEKSNFNLEQIKSFLSSHALTLSFNNTLISSDIATAYDADISLSYLGKEETIVGEITSPLINASYRDYDLSLLNSDFSFSLSNSAFISLSASSLNLTDNLSDSISLSSLSALISLPDISSLDLKKTEAKVDCAKLSAKKDNINIDLNTITGIVNQGSITLSVNTFNGVIEGHRVNLSNLKARTDDYSLFTGSAEGINYSSTLFNAKAEGLHFTEDISSSIFNFTLDNIGAEKLGDIVEAVELDSISGSLNYTDGLKASVNFDSSIKTTNSDIKAITFSVSGDFSLIDNTLKDSFIEIKNLYLGYGERYSSRIKLSGSLDDISLSFKYGEIIDISLNYLERKNLKGSVSVNSLLVNSILPLVTKSKVNFIPDDCYLNLDLSFDLTANESSKLGFIGKVDYLCSLSSLKVLFLNSDFISSGTLDFSQEKVDIILGLVKTQFFTLSLDGYYDLKAMLPNLDFTITGNDNKEYFDGYIHLTSNSSYIYMGNFSYFNNMYLSGEVDFSKENIVSSSSVFETKSRLRPFELIVDLLNKDISIKSDNLLFSLSYLNGIEGKVKLDRLSSLSNSDSTESIILDGELDFSFNFDDGFTIKSTKIKADNIFLLPSDPSISFSLNGKDDIINLTDISISVDGENSYSGNLALDLSKLRLAVNINESDGEGRITLSFYRDEEYVGILKAENINLTSLGLEDMYAKINLFGSAKKLEDFSFNGDVIIASLDANDKNKITGKLDITSDKFLISNVEYSSSSLLFKLDSILLSTKDGDFEISGGYLRCENEHYDRSYPIELLFSLKANVKEDDSLLTFISDTFKNRGDGIEGRFTLSYVDIDNSSIREVDKYFDFSFSNSILTLKGNLLDGSIDTEKKKGDFSIKLDSIITSSFKLDYSLSLTLICSVNGFNMSLINLFSKFPTFVFRDDFVYGEISLKKENGEYILNGDLYSNELGVDVFWVYEQSIIMHNPRFSIWNNELSSSISSTTVIDNNSFERKSIDMSVSVLFSPLLSIDSYICDIYIDENNSVTVRIPLPKTNIDIIGKVYGHYKMTSGGGSSMINEGEVYISDATVSVGMNPYPDWYNYISGGAVVDMTLNFLRNNRILYPAGDDPIFSITLSENSSISILYKNSNMLVTGDVNIRGGEIFYFQKYFYITSGSIVFDDPTTFNPKISLRATLRDYDSSSERVEIYLVMKDNTFDNINPTLESSPAKELSEIMEILGQSILPQSAYGNVTVGSVASLVTEGFDILSRLGIVTTTTNPLSNISSTLKEIFGVDSFSLHSNIINNILSDTISSVSSDNIQTFSTMARFLSGTTLNIGKYLSQNLYLQVMVHLEASKSENAYTIISDDLALDTEISLEWANSAFSVTFFTRPSYFSFYSLFDTFGFSITKSFNF